jgi:hypothetical protein
VWEHIGQIVQRCQGQFGQLKSTKKPPLRRL